MKIWFDLSNSPHINLFARMIRDLQAEGHEVVITCRPLANTIDLLDLHRLRYEVVGVHYGGKLKMKLLGFPIRVWQLWRYLKGKHIDVAISQSSFHSPVVARLLGVRSIYMNDNEHALGNIPAFVCATRIMVPEFLADEKLRKQWASARKVVHYPGVKEGIYLWDFDEQLARKRWGSARGELAHRPADRAASDRAASDRAVSDRAVSEGIPTGGERPTVYIRPEPWTAQYYKGSRNFLDDLILGIKDKTRVVVLPRGKAQGVHYREPRFAGVEVVDTALDLAHVAPDCDLFVGAGGTMTREMAVLGIPTISVYQDELLDVDRYLLQQGAFVHMPALTAPALLSILEGAARKPANRLLLEKGRQAYALIKESILGGRMAEESMGADRC